MISISDIIKVHRYFLIAGRKNIYTNSFLTKNYQQALFQKAPRLKMFLITLKRIETLLAQSYDEAFPGIERLSRISLMSESKLKKRFKQSFGMGLYEYFQKNRMHRPGNIFCQVNILLQKLE